MPVITDIWAPLFSLIICSSVSTVLYCQSRKTYFWRLLPRLPVCCTLSQSNGNWKFCHHRATFFVVYLYLYLPFIALFFTRKHISLGRMQCFARLLENCVCNGTNKWKCLPVLSPPPACLSLHSGISSCCFPLLFLSFVVVVVDVVFAFAVFAVVVVVVVVALLIISGLVCVLCRVRQDSVCTFLCRFAFPLHSLSPVCRFG